MAKDKKGIFGTLIVHGGFILFVIIFGFTTPLPLPDEEGILVNFGTDETGFGKIEPGISEVAEEIVSPPVVEETTPADDAEEILTQDIEEAPAIQEKKITVKESVQETVKKEVIEAVAEEKAPVVEKVREANPLALYKGKSTTDQPSTGEGITSGTGNQGSITGSTESDNYSNALSSGQGGIDFTLAGRNPVSLPKPEYNSQVSGTIVVSIRVNREGQVTSAIPGVKGSNIQDETLMAAARKAALNARFKSKPDAAYSQAGTITYHFVLQ